jgi:hypothetical protein
LPDRPKLSLITKIVCMWWIRNVNKLFLLFFYCRGMTKIQLVDAYFILYLKLFLWTKYEDCSNEIL